MKNYAEFLNSEGGDELCNQAHIEYPFEYL